MHKVQMKILSGPQIMSVAHALSGGGSNQIAVVATETNPGPLGRGIKILVLSDDCMEIPAIDTVVEAGSSGGGYCYPFEKSR